MEEHRTPAIVRWESPLSNRLPTIGLIESATATRWWRSFSAGIRFNEHLAHDSRLALLAGYNLLSQQGRPMTPEPSVGGLHQETGAASNVDPHEVLSLCGSDASVIWWS